MTLVPPPLNNLSSPTISSREVLACKTPLEPNSTLLVPRCWRKKSLDDEIFVLKQTPLLKEHHCCVSNEYTYAAALDLGTTTIVLSIIDTASRRIIGQLSKRNPQMTFGTDLISRIHYATSPQKLRQLQEIILLEISRLFEQLFQSLGLSPQELKHLVVAGNSVMTLLFLGIDPSDLGQTPYNPPSYEFSPRCAGELNLPLLPETPVIFFPLLGGFIGGDLTAGLFALEERFSQFWNGTPQLLMDLGTNGEMILACKGTLFALSTAAGPVFEGAEIHCGMMAQKGAIERVDYTDIQHPISTIGNTEPIGICGSGIIDTVSEMIRLHLISSKGRLAIQEMASNNPLVAKLEIFNDQRTFRLTNQVRIFQKDIRKIQLAIGAIRTGILYLSKYGGISPNEITHFYLAGGLGQHIRIESARQIGLLPKSVTHDQVSFLGNSSLTGAIIAACHPEKLKKASKYRSRTKLIHLIEERNFMEIFAQMMLFDDRDPSLE